MASTGADRDNRVVGQLIAGGLAATLSVTAFAQVSISTDETAAITEVRDRRIRDEEQAALFERIQSLTERGALGLASRLIDDRQQSPDENINVWLRWERQRLHTWLELGDYAGVIARLSVLPEEVQHSDRQKLMLLGVEAELAMGKPAQARARVRSLIWGAGIEDRPTVNTWRRMVIQSYIAEGRYSDARTAMLKLDAESPTNNLDWILLKSRVLLLSGDNEAVIELVKSRPQPEAQLFRVLAGLRAGSVPMDLALDQVRAIRSGQGEDQAFLALSWLIESEAADRGGDAVASVNALEMRAAMDVALKDILIPFDMTQLWRAWSKTASKVVERLSLDPARHEAWLEMADLLVDGDLVSSRSLYAAVVIDSDDYRVKARAHSGLVRTLLAEEQKVPLALRLYVEREDSNNSATIRSRLDELSSQTRIRLADVAINDRDMEAAALLMRGIDRAPQGLSDQQWLLRRARISIYAGEFEEGAAIIQNLVNQANSVDADLMDRLLQPVFDLQSLGEDALALPILRRSLSLVTDARHRSEIPFWMAQSASALKRHAEAAELYLRSADAVDPLTDNGRLWQLSAFSRAAEEMAQSGLPGDARRLYERVLLGIDDEARRADIERRMQQLYLVEAREIRDSRSASQSGTQ